MASSRATDRLIVALDVPSTDEARVVVDELGADVSFYKIGLQLFPVGGVELARDLVAMRKKVFLDFKFYDIGATVRNAVVSASGIGATFLTVHGAADIVAGAVAGRGNAPLMLLAVTVLTSMDEKSLKELGYEGRVSDLVLARARLALEAGADGIVASAREAAMLRRELGGKFLIVTPGIRSAGVPTDDQKRVSTPYDAILAGADYLVVGREITRSPDPTAAAQRVVAQIEKALAERS
jgi:orotidine-5'-phosphate decarboxylase